MTSLFGGRTTDGQRKVELERLHRAGRREVGATECEQGSGGGEVEAVRKAVS